MKEISAKNQRVFGGENCMNPTGGYEDSLSLGDDKLVALVHHVSQERLGMSGQPMPPFVERQVGRSRLDQVEHFFAAVDVIPH